MALSTLNRRHFYQITSLIIDNGADALRSLLENFIQRRYRQTFRDFVSQKQHEIYHYYCSYKCCQCSKQSRYMQKVICVWQMETLFDLSSLKLCCHKTSSKETFCCSQVKQTLNLKDIDITLLRFFLVTFFEDEFWQIWFSLGNTLETVLNTNKHSLYHLCDHNRCCICISDPSYKLTDALVTDKLSKSMWKQIFKTRKSPCSLHNQYDPTYPCCVSATIGLQYTELDSKTRMIILTNYDPLMKHLNVLMKSRNDTFAHSNKAELSQTDFDLLWNETELSIIELSKISGTDKKQRRDILRLKSRTFEDSTFSQLQHRILQEIKKMKSTNDEINEKLKVIDSSTDTTRNIIGKHSKYVDILALYDVFASENTKKEIEFCKRQTSSLIALDVYEASTRLEKHNILILVGQAGSGKSKMALTIASILQDEGYTIMKLEPSLVRDIKTLSLSRQKQLIILEDLFGKSDIRYDEDMHGTLLDVLQPHASNATSKYIITIRSDRRDIIENFIRRHSLLSSANVFSIGRNTSGDGENMSEQSSTSLPAQFSAAAPIRCSCIKSIIDKNIKKVKTDPKGVQSFLKEFGTEHIIKLFNEELETCIAIETDITNCCLDFLEIFLRPASFSVEKGLIGSNTNDVWISQRLVTELLTSEDIDLVKAYISKYGDENFVKTFNLELQLKLEEHASTCTCSWKFFETFVRPAIFQIPSGELGALVDDKNVIERLSTEMLEIQNIDTVMPFIKRYGNEQFILKLNKALSEWFEKDGNTRNCGWNLFNRFVRPITFTIRMHDVIAYVNENTIIHRLLWELRKEDPKIEEINSYIMDYGTDQFIKIFNDELLRWLENENINTCRWDIFEKFVRPATYQIPTRRLGVQIDSKRLSEILRNELFKPESTNKVLSYVKTYGNEHFVKIFNKNLTKWLEIETNMRNVDWCLFNQFVRPSTFIQVKHGVGACISDELLFNRLRKEIQRTDTEVTLVKQYINQYGTENFVAYFNSELQKWIGEESKIKNCSWVLFECFVRPSTFRVTKGEIGACIDDSLVTSKLLNVLEKMNNDNDSRVESYIAQYGTQEFISHFNIEVRKSIQVEATVRNANWSLFSYCIRPSSFTSHYKQIGASTNDMWVVRRLIMELSEKGGTVRVQSYLTKNKTDHFIPIFNGELKLYFKDEQNVMNSDWHQLEYFIRPSTFSVAESEIGVSTNDQWLISRLLSEIRKDKKNAIEVRKYFTNNGTRSFRHNFDVEFEKWVGKTNYNLDQYIQENSSCTLI